MTMQLEAVVMAGATLMIWRERAEDAAGDFARAGDQSVRLVHGHHHGPVIVGFDHRLAGLTLLNPLGNAGSDSNRLTKLSRSSLSSGVDDADPFEGQIRGCGRPP